MRCPRCTGCLLWSTCWDHERVFVMGRCLNCGAILDATMQGNHARPRPPGWVEKPYAVMGCRGARRRPGVESDYDARHP